MYTKESLREEFVYLNGGFYKKGKDPKLRASWVTARYTPVSAPTIFIGDVSTYLKNAVYVYHTDMFDPQSYMVICKDKNEFNTNIENLRLVKRRKEEKLSTDKNLLLEAYAVYFGMQPPNGYIVIPLDGNMYNIAKENLGLIPSISQKKVN
jgi:hypothetical protein